MTSRVTVVVVPRETFSQSVPSLESVLARTTRPFELVYVDAHAPVPVARRLEEHAVEWGFTLVRSSRDLSPNQARNVALAYVRTEYTVFLGNDVFVTEGWLDALVACADETGASFVGGVSCWGALDEPVVYCAGGESHVFDAGGRRGLRDVHHHAGRRVRDVWPTLRRTPSEAAVFHCVLVRTDVLERLGGFDEHLDVFEHIDFCMRAHTEANGGWFDPGSVVMYVPPSPLRPSDVPSFLRRWSRKRIATSVTHFCHTWDLDPADPCIRANLRWIDDHRWQAVGRPRAALRLVAGERAVRGLDVMLDTVAATTLGRRETGGRNAPPSLTLVHESRSQA
jgi:glycosyltransferase involved in cell wall biosynthesis